MKPFAYKSLGYALSVNAPETADEFDTLAGKPGAPKVGACVENANNGIVYRSVSNVFRDRFLHGLDADPAKNIVGFDGLDKKTGIARKMKTVPATKPGGEATEVVDESEANYYNRIIATLVANGLYANATDAQAAYSAFASEVAASITFDPSETERAPKGPKRIGKEYTDAATKVVEAGKADKLASILTKKLGRAVPQTVEGLAVAMKEDNDRENAKRAEALMAKVLA